MSKYLHELIGWPSFFWNAEQVLAAVSNVRHKQGRLLGTMHTLGFDLQQETLLQTLTLDVLKSTEIEGELLNEAQVRSSIARKLGLETVNPAITDRSVEGIVEVMLDATQNYANPLDTERLLGWHAALFPTGRSGMYTITVGDWRKNEKGPMQVVSGQVGKETVHFQAPDSNRLVAEMNRFIIWFNKEANEDELLKSAIAHLWFVTIHPFDDGNGRIARAIADMQLAKADKTPQRFYSVSAQIRIERNQYYDILERTQKGTLDITAWLLWFLKCVDSALNATDIIVQKVLRKARFWDRHAHTSINERQRKMINQLFDGFIGNLTSSKWAKMTKCSTDTALRDIQDLMVKNVLTKEDAGGRSTNYQLAD